MGGIEGIIIALTRSTLLLYHCISARAIRPAPIQIPTTSFFSLIHCLFLFLDPYRYAFLYVFFLSCSTHKSNFFVEWRRMVLYTYSQKFAGS